jgi:hypothetical protein
VSAKMFCRLWSKRKEQGKEQYRFYEFMDLFNVIFERVITNTEHRVYFLFDYELYKQHFGAVATP